MIPKIVKQRTFLNVRGPLGVRLHCFQAVHGMQSKTVQNNSRARTSMQRLCPWCYKSRARSMAGSYGTLSLVSKQFNSFLTDNS